MKLSVLIPTHNRPKLFTRCLTSVLDTLDGLEFEVIVNNDSNDITEIKDTRVKYFYNKFSNLTEIYMFLAEHSNSDFVYYLEDDDVMLKSFRKVLDLLKDKTICGSYFHVNKLLKFRQRVIPFSSESPEFQLSQVVFKRKDLNFSNLKDKCNGDCIFNDYYLFKNSVKDFDVASFCFYRQTTDGRDNISFSEFTNLEKCKRCAFKVPECL